MSACSSAYGRCLYRVPVAEVKAEDGYNIDSYDNDDWYDSDDSPTDMVLDLSNVTIDKTSQPKRMQEKWCKFWNGILCTGCGRYGKMVCTA